MVVGAVIIAAGRAQHGNMVPATKEIGALSAVKRLINTFQQAGIDSIVVAADQQSCAQLEKHIARTGAVCVCSKDQTGGQMFDYAKAGLRYLQNKCDAIMITPVNVPLFMADTVQRLIQSNAPIINPVYKGKSGHPLLILKECVPFILQYQGGGGLRGAVKNSGYRRAFVLADDPGVLCNVTSENNYQSVLENFRRVCLYPSLKVRLVKEQAFFGPGAAQLLSLIRDIGSVRLACQQMGISYSKAWKIIDVMEEQTGYKMVERQQGGKNGGMARLTPEGTALLEKYKRFERACREFSQKAFHEIFETETNLS